MGENLYETARFERTTFQNIRLHVMPTRRFKTYSITVFAGTPLNEKTVTSTALIPFVLRRGNQSHPETKSFREKLENLYGAGFGFDVVKRGDYQMIQFHMDLIHEQFVSENRSLLQEAIQFLGETITAPAMEDGQLRTQYVDAEKETIRKRIEAIINDKMRYAAERCVEETCRNDPYRLRALGKLDDLKQLNTESLTGAYMNWISKASLDIYVVGDTTLEEVRQLCEESFNIGNRNEPTSYQATQMIAKSHQIHEVMENMDVSQGKLNLGLRCPVTYTDDAYPAALMYNGILGAFPHSKLFLNVREKASLAYYAASRLDGHKGLLTIQSGIEFQNYSKALDIIKKQLQAMQDGDLSDLEMNQTKAMLNNALKEMQDSAYELISFDFNSIFAGRERSADEMIHAVNEMERNEIQRVARQVSLDTVYFLKNEKGADANANIEI